MQKVEEMKLQCRKKIEEWKTLKKIQELKTMLEQNKKMDKSQQRMEHLQGVVLYSGLFNIRVNSPLNPTGSQMDQYIPDRCRVDTSHTAHSRPGTCATYSAHTAYRENPFGRDRRR